MCLFNDKIFYLLLVFFKETNSKWKKNYQEEKIKVTNLSRLEKMSETKNKIIILLETQWKKYQRTNVNIEYVLKIKTYLNL